MLAAALRGDDSHSHSPTSSPQLQTTDKSDTSALTTLAAQIESTQVTINPFSFLKYLASRLYYATALRTQKEGAGAALAAFFLGVVAWPLYRVAHVMHVVGAMIFAPITFTLTLSAKVMRASLPLIAITAKKYYLLLTAATQHTSESGPRRKLSDEQKNAEKLKANEQAAAFVAKRGVGLLTEDVHDNNEKNTRLSQSMLNAMNAAWPKFISKCKKAFEKSLHCFMPIGELVAPLYKNAQRDSRWYVALVPCVLALVGAAAFADYVLAQVIIELESKGTLRAGFMDQFGGYYAEAGWHYMVEGLVLSWDKMQVGMEFFVYALVNKAVLPLMELLTIGMPHTSHHTSQFVGTVLLEVMIPMIVMLFAAYKFLKPSMVKSETRKDKGKDDKTSSLHSEDANHSMIPSSTSPSLAITANTNNNSSAEKIIDLSKKNTVILSSTGTDQILNSTRTSPQLKQQ